MKHHASSLSREQRERRRLKAAKLFKKGVAHAEIARRLGVSPSAVTLWRAAYRHGGKKSLESKGRTGFASRLTPKKQARFRDAVLKGPLAHGYATNLWTLSRLAAVMKKVAGVRFSGVWTWHIMRTLGFTPQKPELRAKERNEEAIAEWKKKDPAGAESVGGTTWVLPRLRGRVGHLRASGGAKDMGAERPDPDHRLVRLMEKPDHDGARPVHAERK